MTDEERSFTTPRLRIDAEPYGHLFRLHLTRRADDVYIGEYERSIEKHLDAKRREIEQAAELLLDTYERHGMIAVRWNTSERSKEIRAYVEGARDPGRESRVLAVIPKEFHTER